MLSVCSIQQLDVLLGINRAYQKAVQVLRMGAREQDHRLCEALPWVSFIPATLLTPVGKAAAQAICISLCGCQTPLDAKRHLHMPR